MKLFFGGLSVLLHSALLEQHFLFLLWKPLVAVPSLEKRGNSTDFRIPSCPTPSWSQAKTVRSHRISLVETKDPWHVL